MKLETFDYAGYLANKKLIDDYSLNPRVWQTFSDWLMQRRNEKDTLDILEAGAGTGTMIIRLLETGLLQKAKYTAIEMQPAFRQPAFEALCAWCDSNNYRYESLATGNWLLTRGESSVEVCWLSADLLQIGQLVAEESCHLLLSHAVVDLLPVPDYLPVLLNRLVPGGAFLFTINYAGDTVFVPADELDATVMSAYHGDMDRRFTISGWQPSRTGELLGPWLSTQGHILLADGDSNWYLPSEYIPPEISDPFVINILDTMESALPDLEGMTNWLAIRRQQLVVGILQFQAANRDYFGLKAST